MTNVLEAIINISKLEDHGIKDVLSGNNRANNMGEGLETFVKNAFSDAFKINDKEARKKIYKKYFSHQGSKKSPPDLMLKGGDAIEVKKTESLSSELQLNSSHPKAKLFSTSTLINEACRGCEKWEEKDFIYVVGHIPKKSKRLSSLWFIHGEIYASDEKVYMDLKNLVSAHLKEAGHLDTSETKEIGRLNSVDQLNISKLRIRGMWLLQSPYKTFKDVHEYDSNLKFQTIAILSTAKYLSYPEESRTKIEADENISIKDIQVKDPNDIKKSIAAKLITFKLND